MKYLLKNHIGTFVFGLFLGWLLLLSSCDTRYDLWLVTNQNPSILISSSPHFTDTVKEVCMLHGEERVLYFRLADDHKLDSIVNVFAKVNTKDTNLYCTIDVLLNNQKIIIRTTEHEKTITPEKKVKAEVVLSVNDYYLKTGQSSFNLIIKDNEAPDLDLRPSVTHGEDYCDIEVSINGTDPDGDNIVAYEYLFWEIANPTAEIKFFGSEYEDPNNTAEFSVNSGKAASGGWYIHAIPQNKVKYYINIPTDFFNHPTYPDAFLAERNAVLRLAYRAKDSRGRWSGWLRYEYNFVAKRKQ